MRKAITGCSRCKGTGEMYNPISDHHFPCDRCGGTGRTTPSSRATEQGGTMNDFKPLDRAVVQSRRCRERLTERNPHMRKLTILLALVLACTIALPAQAATSRKWKATYNAALSAKYAAVPKVYKVGSKLRVCYRSNCTTVIAALGSCTCFDLSDEAFLKLAGSLSKGVITVEVEQR